MGGGGGRGGGSNCLIVLCVLVFMAYYAPNKFSSLLFSPGTLNGDVDNNYGLTSFANCHL